MKNPWFRLYAEFASDPKVQSMSETFQRRLVMLFCLRCSEDLKVLSEDEIRCALRISPQEFFKTKNLFIEKGFILPDFTLKNWDKRQFVSDDVSQRVQRHREKVKRYSNVIVTEMKRPCNGNVTPPDTDTDTDKRKDLVPCPPQTGDMPDLIPSLLSRYSESEQGTIAEVFKCLATTRQTGKMAASIKLAELKYWDTFEKWKVMDGIYTYLDKGLHSVGKSEKYLRGIIRNTKESKESKNRSEPATDPYAGIPII